MSWSGVLLKFSESQWVETTELASNEIGIKIEDDIFTWIEGKEVSLYYLAEAKKSLIEIKKKYPNIQIKIQENPTNQK